MSIRSSNSLILSMLAAGTVLILGATGCAQRQTSSPDLAYTRQAPPAPASEHIAGKRFVLTETGQRYYVDSRGARHVITREVTEPSGIGGVFYYIEDDERPYYLDERERLYYRDSSGRVSYIEDVTQGRPIEPEVVYRGERTSMRVAQSPQVPWESCASQWEDCMSGCKGISPRQKYDRPNCISNCDTIRNQCRDRR